VLHPYAIGEQAQLFVDTNMIPASAISRIEVLKDGAAALYGSDAIAGVVNFITRDDLEGFELGGNYQTYDGTDGEYQLNGAFGLQGDGWNWVTSVGYSMKNEVPLTEKDWAILPYADNPVGGWSSLSNPGYYVALGTGATILDSGCTAVGGTEAPTCRFQFTQFDNLVEEEERYNIFSEYNREFSGANLHLEALWGKTDVPSWKTSPSYPPQALLNQVVPATHPGLQQYIADNPSAADLGIAGGLFLGRSFGWGGFPGTGSSQEGFRKYDTLRLSGSLDGQWSNGINWDLGLTYHKTEGERETNDTYINGLTIALQGFGVCGDPNTGDIPAGAVAGQGGCEYYNPFSNAIPANAVTGEANPNYVPGLENSAALAEWLTDGVGTVVTSDLIVLDGVVSGESGIQAAGGGIGWAAGFQVRREGYEVNPNEVTDLALNPGPAGNGPFSFLAGTNASDSDQTIYALFGELQIPLYDDLDVQVAMRYEDYGGETGSTFDPKIAAKWQVTDTFSLRGSAQTSFKGPTLNQNNNGVATTLQYVAPALAFKAVDQFGNPDLKPESAFSFNLGGIYETGGFFASLDYYNFDFSDPIIVEDQASIVSAAVAALAAGDTESPILSRITFNDPNAPSASTISRIETNVVNGPDIKTSGIDVRVQNDFGNIGGGADFTVGFDASYIIEYDVSDFFIEGVLIPGGDRVGQFNRSNFSRSLPQWKANLFGNLAMGDHNVRLVMRHVDSYKDERSAAARGGVGAKIDSQTTFDLFYNWNAPYQFDLGLGVVNLTDEDPPFAAFDLNYDPYTHNPFGRTFKISLTKKFGPGE
jgi:outer membrane receptor protein involved in Fe transport